MSMRGKRGERDDSERPAQPSGGKPTGEESSQAGWDRPLSVDEKSLDAFTVARMTDHNVTGGQSPGRDLPQIGARKRNDEVGRLRKLRVAVLATDGFEQSELTEPVRALRENGARVDIISIQKGKIQAFVHQDKGIQIEVDRTLREASPAEYDAVVLPGGALNADRLRVDPQAQSFVRAMQAEGKPIGVICHGPWLLASAGLLRGRKLTSYHTIRDDLVNAGANWVDEKVVIDGNWVTSRQPSDLPAFNREWIHLLENRVGNQLPGESDSANRSAAG